ncbi:MAG: hypothetical protein O2895_07075 [Chloroflexi bacterium]|nr:hypothetical protein [Chloroflexota bacterium]
MSEQKKRRLDDATAVGLVEVGYSVSAVARWSGRAHATIAIRCARAGVRPGPGHQGRRTAERTLSIEQLRRGLAMARAGVSLDAISEAFTHRRGGEMVPSVSTQTWSRLVREARGDR